MHQQYTGLTCAHCGAPTRKSPSQIPSSGRVFCSNACVGKALKIAPEIKVWSKIDRRGPDECWPWTGAKYRNGYGHVGINGKTVSAHRAVYELTYGPIPPRMVVAHKCDQKFCCNPSHLEVKTNRENLQDAVARGLMPLGEERRHAKLTAAQVVEIRNLYIGGASHKSIAARFGVTAGAVQSILDGTTWKHIGPPIKRGRVDQITPEIKAALMEAASERKHSYSVLAAMFGVTYSQAYRAINPKHDGPRQCPGSPEPPTA